MAFRLPWPIRMRKALRLKDFDYSSNGAYFVTVCTHCRRPLLTGSVRGLAERLLLALADRFAGLALDSHNVMPDHVHAIPQLSGCTATLSDIVQAYKSLATLEIKRAVKCDRVWQRGFHDRIVRNEIELMALREYIAHNAIVHAVRAEARPPRKP